MVVLPRNTDSDEDDSLVEIRDSVENTNSRFETPSVVEIMGGDGDEAAESDDIDDSNGGSGSQAIENASPFFHQSWFVDARPSMRPVRAWAGNQQQQQANLYVPPVVIVCDVSNFMSYTVSMRL